MASRNPIIDSVASRKLKHLPRAPVAFGNQLVLRYDSYRAGRAIGCCIQALGLPVESGMRVCNGLLVSCVTALFLAPSDAFATYPHIARTKASITVIGKQLPPGSYIPITYDGGTVWITTIQGAAPLPKTIATVLPNTQYPQPLDGIANRRTPVFRMVPNTFVDPTRLEQQEIDRFRRPVIIDRGKIFKIAYRQGDDYIVVLDIPGVNRDGVFYGRIPVSATDVISGPLDKGRDDPVPPSPTGFK
jgi:hypothetical protein